MRKEPPCPTRHGRHGCLSCVPTCRTPARVLRVDGIVLLAVREHGTFFEEDHRIRLTAEAPNYGEVIGDLGSVARELHLHCAKRAGRSVA